MHDGRVEQSLIFSDQSPRYSEYQTLTRNTIALPTNTKRTSVAKTVFDIWRARLKLRQRYKAESRIVHVIMGSPWDIFYLPVAKKNGATILFTVHDAARHQGEENAVLDWISNRLIGLADHLIVLSDFTGKALKERFNIQVPVHTMSGALILNESEPAPAKTWNGKKPLRLLFFGRIFHYKGLSLLLEAFELVKKNSGKLVELTVAGEGDLTPYREALMRCPEVKIINSWISDEAKEAIFASHDINMVPYLDTFTSAVTLDGMWAGMPTIATPLPAFEQQLHDEENALIATEITALALADKIEMISNSKELYNKLAIGANVKARTLSAPFVANMWHDLFAKIANEKSRNQ